MKVKDIEEKIIAISSDILKVGGITKRVTEHSSLIGKDPVLDSMGLVELCVSLEDLSADEYDFDFDWTSEKAMSATKSMFRSVASLAEEFYEQWSSNQ
jgi:acyl carrier protein